MWQRWIFILLFSTLVMSKGHSPPPLRKFTTYSFSNQPNKTISIENTSYILHEGSLPWPRFPHIQPSLAVIHSLISSEEISSIMKLLNDSSLSFDEDPDSVDDMATHEIYLQRNGNIEGVKSIEGKLDQFPAVYNQRLPFREKLNKILQPIISERILPFINSYYTHSCGLSGQQCHVCHSLVRKYQAEERMTHPAHFDTHALITGVIALNSYGRDYEGGIYVSVGVDPSKDENEQYIGLQEGDVLFHQSNLLHGVRVESGTRWSWIIWIKDSENCTENNPHWTRPQALSGDPIAQYIHSKRSPLREKIYWLNESAKSGFGMAANELGLMYTTGNSELPKNLIEAKRLLLSADSVPEAYFNLGMLAINDKEISQAVDYFKQAAYLGEISKAAQNVGVAYYHGRSVERDLMAAVEWWERAGNGDSLMKAAQTLLLKDPSLPPVNFSRVLHLFRRSANTGHAPAATYLGNYYENLGQRGEALPWYLKAARQGDLEARRALERIEKAHKSMKDTLLEEDEDTKEDIEEQEL